MPFKDLIGLPFRRGARGPLEYDCYGLLIEIYRRRGVSLNSFTYPSRNDETENFIYSVLSNDVWTPCAPRPNTSILLNVRGSNCHVGYQLDEFTFIHSIEKTGVCVERLSRWNQYIAGNYEYAR